MANFSAVFGRVAARLAGQQVKQAAPPAPAQETMFHRLGQAAGAGWDGLQQHLTGPGAPVPAPVAAPPPPPPPAAPPAAPPPPLAESREDLGRRMMGDNPFRQPLPPPPGLPPQLAGKGRGSGQDPLAATKDYGQPYGASAYQRIGGPEQLPGAGWEGHGGSLGAQLGRAAAKPWATYLPPPPGVAQGIHNVKAPQLAAQASKLTALQGQPGLRPGVAPLIGSRLGQLAAAGPASTGAAKNGPHTAGGSAALSQGKGIE